MAIGVDSSKWKPRKLVGTPAGRGRNLVGLGIVSVGFLIGVIYQYSDLTKNYRQNFEKLYTDPVENIERKLIIASGLPARSGDTLRLIMEEEARPDTPDK